MTAAAVKPDLFTHLFATQRTHPDRRDLAASALSISLHGGVLMALIWASTTLAPDQRATVEPIPIPIVIAAPDVTDTRSPGSGGSNPALSPSAPRYDVPTIDPSIPIGPPNTDPWVEPSPQPAPGPGKTPEAGGGGEPEMRGGFIVTKEIPQLLNTAEVQRSLQRNYPAILRDAGVGGRVTLWLLIDENGRVIDTDVRESSGQEAFDSAAARVAGIMRFSPGKNRENNVKVWVSLPVLFKTR
jgi:protein TonB